MNIMGRALVVLILIVTQVSMGVAQNSRWNDHFSYRNALGVAETDNYVATYSEMGLMLFDKRTSELETISRVNGLSDIGISALQALSDDRFIVGYANGNIDIVFEDAVANIPDFKLKQLQGTKQINHFYVHDSKVYCSTDYALVVIDPVKREVSDTYFLGQNAESLTIYQTVVEGDFIYAATERGLLRAELSDPLIVYDKAWTLISSSNRPCVGVNYHGGVLVAVTLYQGNYTVQKGSVGQWTFLLNSGTYRSMDVFAGKLVISLLSRVSIYDENFSIESEFAKYSFGGNLAVQGARYSSYEDAYFMADKNYGLVKVVSSADDVSYVANGPYSNNSFYLHATRQGVYSSAGGITADYNNLDRTIEYSFFDTKKNNWSAYKSPIASSAKSSRDLLRICSSKTNDADVYMSSWGGGIYEVQGTDSITHYGEREDGLHDIYPDDRMYVRVGGIASDSEGNIWMSNSSVDNGIVVKSNDRWYQFDYATTKSLHSTGQILITKDDYVWIPIPMFWVGDRQGIMVINTNGTLLDDADDEYKSGAPAGYGGDKRNVGKLRLWDENRNEITRVVLSMAEDKNGYIWLGTDKGVLVYYRPWAIFSEEYPVASRIKVPRSDGSNLADYLLEKERISSIAVDGANRKWIGTEGAGLYLVSEDGLKTYHTFNTANSPLPSNSITSITISPVNGEVFVGTAKGIVSYKARATEGTSSFEKIYAYPNPVREDFTGEITITGLMQNSIVKITTVSGKLVHQTKSLGGNAYWDGENLRGEKVKTGVYLIYVSGENGEQSGMQKLLIMR